MKHFFLYCSLGIACMAAPGSATVDYEGNLKRIPATDPSVDARDAVSLLPAARGVHPRLLFTAADIERLKAQIPKDPVLKKSAENTLTWARRFKLSPAQAASVVTSDTPALSVANGSWPMLAYGWALERDPAMLKGIVDTLEFMLSLPYWGDTAELDSSMGAACNLHVVALLFDAAHDDLSPDLRSRVAARLLVQARRMYYLGHRQLSLMPIKYWQQDPMPNHRWYRARGLAAALLAITGEPGIDTAYLLGELKKETDFLIKWYPEEGDCHEGAGYQQFGFRMLADTATMMDRVVGTRYLSSPGFANAWMQQVYYWIPYSRASVSFGDDQNQRGVFNYDDSAFFIGPHLSRDPLAQGALLNRLKYQVQHPDPKRPENYPWSLLQYYDPTVPEGDCRAVPVTHLFQDLGAAVFRDSWGESGVVFTFKCGPYGGQRLNEYRHANPDKNGNPHYVNVAHDDPDANSFTLNVAGDTIFHPGLYSVRKVTREHSTVTLGDTGQLNEGSDYTQPLANRDMRELSWITGWKVDSSGRAVIEGETGPAYGGGFERFRRTALWLPGEYILILDDLRATAGAALPVWRGVVPAGSFSNPEQGTAIAGGGAHAVPMQFMADVGVSAALDDFFLPGRWGHQLVKQFQFTPAERASRPACLLDPWKRGVKMSYQRKGDTVELTVRGPAGTDIFVWNPAPDGRAPSSIRGTRDGHPLISLTAADTIGSSAKLNTAPPK